MGGGGARGGQGPAGRAPGGQGGGGGKGRRWRLGWPPARRPGWPWVGWRRAGGGVPGVPPRLVALGDLHGDLGQAEAALQLAGATDSAGAWAGRTGDVLVQCGDLVDRGPGSLAVLRRFEDLAGEAGGAVELLLGNHELMNLQRDFRYVNKNELIALGQATLGGELKGAAAAGGETSGSWGQELGNDPAKNLRELRAGVAEWDRLWQVGGRWGAALAAQWKVAAVRGEGRCRLLFSHAGISPGIWAGTGVFGAPGGDGRLAALGLEMSEVLRQGQAGATARLAQAGGPLWFRGYAEPCRPGGDCRELEELCKGLGGILDDLGVEAMVVGHTVQEDGKILSRCPDPSGQPRLFVIDVGMSRAYLGNLAALECQGGVVSGLYPWGREVLADFNTRPDAGAPEL